MFDSQRTNRAADRSADAAHPLVHHLPTVGIVTSMALAVVIALLSLMPVDLSRTPPVIGIDKIFHFVAYAALVFPVVVTRPRRWVWAVASAIAFGGVIEIVQAQVGREADWADVLANALGAGIGAWAGIAIHRAVAARFRPKRT